MRSSEWRALRAAAIVVVATSSVARGEVCAPEPQGDGRVAAVIDARTLRLDDGREIRLAAIETSGVDATTLGRLALGRTVSLHGDGDAPDRYGRQIAWVFIDGTARSVQTELVADGAAVASGGVLDAACRSELLTAEAQARRDQRGVWRSRAVIKNAESPGDNWTDIGQFTVVTGRVQSVRQVGAVTYLNFGRRWTRDFAVTIAKPALASFEAAGMLPKSLENQRIRVRGFVERRGGPRIEAGRPEQIEIVGADDAAGQ